MTSNEIAKLRDWYLAKNKNIEGYKDTLKREALRLGREVRENATVLEMEQAAIEDGSGSPTIIRDATAARNEGNGDEGGEVHPQTNGGELPSECDGATPRGASEVEAEDGNGEDNGDGEGKPRRKRRGRIETLADRIHAAREKAEALKREAEEAEERARQYEEEIKRRQEEEKRKREEEMRAKRHVNLDEVVATLEATGISYLVGPAGTGKSSLAMSACEELFGVKKETPEFNKCFAQISFSPDTTSGEMVGRSDINGAFHESEVVRVFRDGGLILFDEIDNADASMLVKLNTAIANGTIATPNGVVYRNKRTFIVCTANTFGTGPDAMYVGRTRLDAATLDRFVLSIIEVDYDRRLEGAILSSLGDNEKAELTRFISSVRGTIAEQRLRRVMSTRFVVNAVKFLTAGHCDLDDIKERYFRGWTYQERVHYENYCKAHK